VRIDAGLVEQVLVNLIENALKYTPAESALHIEARADAAEDVVITVSDEGPGVPPGEEERIFEKFYRGGSGVQRGFGLGLPICRAIVTAHGGRIWAENRHPRGAAFRFTLGPRGPSAPIAPENDEASK
jgi:two-component system sensor histidine kinase KdpD